jgi:hypothetical protein
MMTRVRFQVQGEAQINVVMWKDEEEEGKKS